MHATSWDFAINYNGHVSSAGADQDFIQVSLNEGAVSILVNLGSGMSEIEVNPKKRFDDNRWHHVHITRDSREVSLAKWEKSERICHHAYHPIQLIHPVKFMALFLFPFRHSHSKPLRPLHNDHQSGSQWPAIAFGSIGCNKRWSQKVPHNMKRILNGLYQTSTLLHSHASSTAQILFCENASQGLFKVVLIGSSETE